MATGLAGKLLISTPYLFFFEHTTSSHIISVPAADPVPSCTTALFVLLLFCMELELVYHSLNF